MHTICPSCFTRNQIPLVRIQDDAKCGHCSHALYHGEVLDANENLLNRFTLDDLPIVIDFWAPWCGPCVGFAPIFSEVATLYAKQARFIKINTEQELKLSSDFQIRSIPTLLLLQQGRVIDKLNGAAPKEYFIQWLDIALNKVKAN